MDKSFGLKSWYKILLAFIAISLFSLLLRNFMNKYEIGLNVNSVKENILIIFGCLIIAYFAIDAVYAKYYIIGNYLIVKRFLRKKMEYPISDISHISTDKIKYKPGTIIKVFFQYNKKLTINAPLVDQELFLQMLKRKRNEFKGNWSFIKNEI